MLYLVVVVYDCVYVCGVCGRTIMASFFVICLLLRGSGTSGGIGGMVGNKYCMWVEYMVVSYVCVFSLCPLALYF